MPALNHSLFYAFQGFKNKGQIIDELSILAQPLCDGMCGIEDGWVHTVYCIRSSQHLHNHPGLRVEKKTLCNMLISNMCSNSTAAVTPLGPGIEE